MSTSEASAGGEHQSSAGSSGPPRASFGPGLEAWQVPVRSDALSREARLSMAIRCASLAPSSHNAQPWYFVERGGALELHVDRTRALPVADPCGRELVMSCGAALFQLTLAARVLRLGARVETFPEGVAATCLARVILEHVDDPSEEDFGLFAQIPRRRTFRMALDPRPVPADVVTALVHAASVEGGVLCVLGDAHRTRVSELVAEGDRRQGADAAFRRELASWLRHKEDGYGDGMVGRSFGLGAVASCAFPFVVRAFDWGAAQAEKDAKAVREAPLLAALTSVEDDEHAWLATGRALGRVLLVARAHGLSASFFNQPVQVSSLRADLARLTGGHPQILMRLGHAEEITPSLRRPLDAILRTGA